MSFSAFHHTPFFVGECTIDSLSRSIKAHPSVVKKHVGFWVSQGLLKEISTDVYGLVQEYNFHNKVAVKCKSMYNKVS